MADGGAQEPMDTLESVSHNGGKLECPTFDGTTSQESLPSASQPVTTSSVVTMNGPDGIQVKQESSFNATPSTHNSGSQPIVGETCDVATVTSRVLKTEGVPTSLSSTLIPPATHSTPDVLTGTQGMISSQENGPVSGMLGSTFVEVPQTATPPTCTATLMPSLATTSTISTPNPSLAIASTVSTPNPSLAIVSTVSTPNPSLAIASTVSTPNPSLAIASTISTPNPSLVIASTISTPNPSLAIISTVSTPNPSLAIASTISTPSPSLVIASTISTPNPSLSTTATISTPNLSLSTTSAASTPSLALSSSLSSAELRTPMEGLLSPNSKTKSSTSAQISNHAQELAKQALNHIIQQKGLDKEKIWEFVSKLKRFLNNLIQMASRKGSTVKQAVESNVYKLMYNQITEENFVANLERDLKSAHQDVLLPFLKESVPYLRLFIYQKQQFERYIQAMAEKKLQVPAVAGQDGENQGVPANGAPAKKDLTNQTPPAGLSLSPQVLLRMKQETMKQGGVGVPGQSTARPGPSAVSTSGQQLSMPGLVDTNKTASTLAAKVKVAKMITKGAGKMKSGGRGKTDKPGTSSAPILVDEEDDDDEELAGVDLKEESAHFLPTSAITVSSGHCEDELLIPADLLKRRILRTAAKKGVTEVTDEGVALVSHAVEERLKVVMEKLTVICSHRMQTLKDQDSLTSSSNVKEQLKFLESIDRYSAQRKQDQEREKVLKAAKSRNKDDPEVARMKEQARMLQLEKEEEIRKRAANETALAAIQGTRKRTYPSEVPAPGSGSLGTGDVTGGGTFATPIVPPRQKQKRRINIRDLTFSLEQEKKSRKSLLLYKSLTK